MATRGRGRPKRAVTRANLRHKKIHLNWDGKTHRCPHCKYVLVTSSGAEFALRKHQQWYWCDNCYKDLDPALVTSWLVLKS